MSLIINEGSSTSIPLLPEDTYPAVCNMLVDLGEQYSEKFDKTSRQILICWEIPSEKLDNGESRRLSKTYTASLNSKGNLRRDLIAWRGRDFTVDELKAFDLKNIVGAPCMLQVIHRVGQDGVKRAVIGGIMKLPKGMPLPTLTNGWTIYDLDADDAEDKIEELPEWIQERIKGSETWKHLTEAKDERDYAAAERTAIQSEGKAPEATPALMDIDGSDGKLPF